MTLETAQVVRVIWIRFRSSHVVVCKNEASDVTDHVVLAKLIKLRYSASLRGASFFWYKLRSLCVKRHITNGSSRNHLCRSDCSRNVDYTGKRSMLFSKMLVQWKQILLRVIRPPSPIKQYEPHYSPSPSTLSCLAVKKCMYLIPFASLSPTDTPLSSSPEVFIPFPHIPFSVAIYIRYFPPFLSLPPPLSSKLY